MHTSPLSHGLSHRTQITGNTTPRTLTPNSPVSTCCLEPLPTSYTVRALLISYRAPWNTSPHTIPYFFLIPRAYQRLCPRVLPLVPDDELACDGPASDIEQACGGLCSRTPLSVSTLNAGISLSSSSGASFTSSFLYSELDWSPSLDIAKQLSPLLQLFSVREEIM